MVALSEDTEQRTELSQVKQAICERLSEGQTLTQVCAAEGFPDRSTVFRWRNLDPLFNETITRAYQSAATVYGDKVIAIADKLEAGRGDWAKDRAASDNYKWAASKFYPKMFGDAQPRTLHQTYVAGDVQVIADEPQRQAMIQARQQFLNKGDCTGNVPRAVDTESSVSPSKQHDR